MRQITLSFFFIFLMSCATVADEKPILSPTLAGSLQPYQSPVPSHTPLPPTPAPTETPLPTPTPHLYQVSSGETMGDIALKFGITINSLIAANPNVQPSAMSVGQNLIIPDRETISNSVPTPGPLDLDISSPDCYPTLSGGMWCFALVQNGEATPVESVSAQISLSDLNGQNFASEVAFMLLDRLPPGDELPVLAFFAKAPVEVSANANAVLLTAVEVPADDSRYLPALLRNVFTEISWDGISAEVSGEVVAEGVATQVWVLATAYDAIGNVIGARRWESVAGERKFHILVASLGPAIDQIDLIVEAKP